MFGSEKTHYEYYMSVHMGVCTTADAVEAIYINDKLAWRGNRRENGVVRVFNLNLFGGRDKEGGISGFIAFMLGGARQRMPAFWPGKVGRTQADCPAFRGLTSLLFTGYSTVSGVKNTPGGFLWTFNRPQIPPVKVRVRRAPRGLPGDPAIGPDANPAHLIYETLAANTGNTVLSTPAEQFDTQSFIDAAATLRKEKFGLSGSVSDRVSTEDFVGQILDHIKGVIAADPRSGKIRLKLLRDDYDKNKLRRIDPETAVLRNFQRRGYAELVNQITVQWTNPKNERQQPVTVQDLSSLAIQNGLVDETRNLPWIRNARLATRVASRELREAAAPLASMDIEMDRSGWDILAGDVLAVDWPEYGLRNLVVRVGAIDYGTVAAPRVRFSVVEDIFALRAADYPPPPPTLWVDPARPPRPMRHTSIRVLPRQLAQQAGGRPLPAGAAASGILASPRDSGTDSYALQFETVDASGRRHFVTIDELRPVARGRLAAPVPAEAKSVVKRFDDLNGHGAGPVPGGFVWIGGGDDRQTELALIESAGQQGLALRRGIIDTVPRAWPAGTPVWFVSRLDDFTPDRLFAAPATLKFRLLSRTARGLLPEKQAPVIAQPIVPRPHLPHRPANVRVNGIGFGANVTHRGNGPVRVTWANRNARAEADATGTGLPDAGSPGTGLPGTDALPTWTDGDRAPEAGQTVTVTVNGPNGRTLATHAQLTGQAFNMPLAAFGGEPVGFVTVRAAKGGATSLQGMTFRVAVPLPPTRRGYGRSWGYRYGSGVPTDLSLARTAQRPRSH